MIQRKRIVALYEIHVIMLVQNRKHKRTLYKFSHFND